MVESKEGRKAAKEEKGGMTVQEAGRRGGMKTSATHGREFYEAIGHKGGSRVKELIEKAKAAEAAEGAEKAERLKNPTVGEAGRKGGERTKRLIDAGRGGA